MSSRDSPDSVAQHVKRRSSSDLGISKLINENGTHIDYIPDESGEDEGQTAKPIVKRRRVTRGTFFYLIILYVYI